MKRISVTMLEKFRRVMAGASGFDTEESLIECITGKFTGNPKTHFGGAYHQILEGDFQKISPTKVKAGSYVFTAAQAKAALDYRKKHPGITHEMSIRKIYDSKYFPIQITGRVDAAEGLAIRDTKTKFGHIDWQDYIDSCQWKTYLSVLEADVFFYDLFLVKGFEDQFITTPEGLAIPPDVIIEAQEPLKCLRYAEMEYDIISLMNEFLDYLNRKNIVHLLKPALADGPIFS